MRIAITLFLVLWVLPSVPGLHCQQPYLFTRGDHVRVYHRGVDLNLWDRHGPDAVGTVLRLTSDSMVLLDDDGTTVVVQLDSVGGIEVNRGRQSNWLKGMTAGAVFGAGAGLVTGLIVSFETQGCRTGMPLELSADCQDSALSILRTMGLGALVGAVLGGAVGSCIKTDRWEIASFEQGAVGFIASRGRFGFGASVRF